MDGDNNIGIILKLREKYLKYKVFFITLIILMISIAVYMFTAAATSTIMKIINIISIGLIPACLIGILLDLLIKNDFLEYITAKVLGKDTYKSGIRNIDLHRGNLTDYFERAKEKIWISITHYCALTELTPRPLDMLVRKSSHVEIKILGLDPRFESARLRSRESGKHADVVTKIKISGKEVMNAFLERNKEPETKVKDLEIKLYDKYPFNCLFLVDSKIFFSPLVSHKRGKDSIHFLVHEINYEGETSELFSQYKKHFQELFKVKENTTVLEIKDGKEITSKPEIFDQKRDIDCSRRKEMLILILDNFDPSLPEKLKEYGDVTFDESRLCEADVALIRSKTKCDEKFIDRAKNLKLIVRGGVGLDNIDISYANSKNIIVKNTPKASGIAVAELAFGMMLAISNHIIEAHNSIKKGNWQKENLVRMELYGKTICLIGMGNTAKELAIRCKAFGMNVIGYRKSKNASEYADVKPTLKDAVKDADYISIHLPLNRETEGIINADIIKCMKDGVVIINTSRAECVNAEDIKEALDSSKVKAYANDVWPKDPPPKNYPILEAPRTLLTPHLGANTRENLVRIGEEITKIIEEFVDHGYKG